MRLARLMRWQVRLGLSLAAIALSVAAEAQTRAPRSDPDDIIVTARKRAEQALRVPAVATVIGADEIKDRQITDLHGVAALTPGLILGAAPLEVGTEISLRGVGSSPLDPGVDQSVALNLDGLPLGQGAAYSAGLFDMARVEVLKGPQSLYFGKNSPGGVIAIRTADPGSETEVIGSAAYEAVARQWQEQLILSAPVTDTLGLRLSSQYSAGAGYFRNTAIAIPASGAKQPDARFGRNHSLYLRLTGLFQPTADLTARFKINATHERSLGGVQEQLINCPDGTFNYLPTIGLNLPSQYSANETCKADRNVNIVDMDPRYYRGLPNDGVPYTQSDQRFATLETNWALAPHFNLTSVTGYYHLAVDAMQNGPWSGGAAPPLAITKALRREETTQEFRLVSNLPGALDFTAGAFFQNATIRDESSFLGNAAYGLPAVVLQGSHDVGIRSFALFGQLRFRPATRLELAGGVRWTDEKRSDTPVTYDVLGVYSGVQGTALRPTLPKLRSRNWSPELTLTWSLDRDLTIFGALKQGYKSGSYNINQPVTPGSDNSFGDERGRGGEVGLKGYAEDRQLFFDLAGYYYQYTGLQAGIIKINAAGLPTLSTVNAGAAKVYGGDLTLRYRPRVIPELSVSGAVNWNHAYFTRFVNADCKAGQTVSEGCNLLPTRVTDPGEIAAGYFSIDPVLGVPVRYNGQDLSGTPLHRAPAWQGTASIDYRMPLGRKLMLALGGRVQYSSSYVIDLGNRDHGLQSQFAKIGATVQIKAPDDRWEVALIGNNLTDRLTAGGCLNINYPAGGGVFPGTITGALLEAAGAEAALRGASNARTRPPLPVVATGGVAPLAGCAFTVNTSVVLL